MAIVTYFRSSSYNTWDFCPHKWYLSYVLGMKEPTGFKAAKGNMVHKALELLAKRKLSEQTGCPIIDDEETGLTLSVLDVTPERAMRIGFEHYQAKEPHLTFKEKDYRDCWKWLNNGLEFRNGLYNPLKRKIIAPEQFFSFVIEEPWAEYHYTLPDGTKLNGHLGLKGTIDLVTEHPIGVIEYLDWKTGRRKDWATGKEKDFKKLCVDPQLRMYHYALSKIYPNARDIFVTIFFLQFLEPFSICFSESDLKETELMLRKRFELIRSTTKPPRIINNGVHNWKCNRLCHFGKTLHEDGKHTVCEHIHRELITLGMDRVNEKYLNTKSLTSYGEGGGSTSKESQSNDYRPDSVSN